MHTSVICNPSPPPPSGWVGNSGANVRGSDFFRPPAMAGKCWASDITQISTPPPRVEFTIIKSRAMTQQVPVVHGF